MKKFWSTDDLIVVHLHDGPGRAGGAAVEIPDDLMREYNEVMAAFLALQNRLFNMTTRGDAPRKVDTTQGS